MGGGIYLLNLVGLPCIDSQISSSNIHFAFMYLDETRHCRSFRAKLYWLLVCYEDFPMGEVSSRFDMVTFRYLFNFYLLNNQHCTDRLPCPDQVLNFWLLMLLERKAKIQSSFPLRSGRGGWRSWHDSKSMMASDKGQERWAPPLQGLPSRVVNFYR